MIWCRGVVVITTAKVHSVKPELRFCAGSNPACGTAQKMTFSIKGTVTRAELNKCDICLVSSIL